MKLSCQEQLLPGGSLQEKFEFAQRCGFDGIELRGRGGFAFRERLPELRRAMADGVPMPTVCVEMSHFIGDFDADRRRDAIDNMRSQLSVIAEIGGEAAMTPAAYGMFSRRLPPFEPPRSPEQDRAVLFDALGELGKHAETEGVRMLIEPLNRYEDHMINRLSDAVDLVQAVGSDAVRVVADTYHMNIEEDDPAKAVLTAGPYIKHVQVSDSNRFQPGAGHVDWPAVLGALRATGYDGWLAVECRLRGEPAEALQRVPAFLRRMAGEGPRGR
jgi:sugar phosphate isomerase/epimerase